MSTARSRSTSVIDILAGLCRYSNDDRKPLLSNTAQHLMINFDENSIAALETKQQKLMMCTAMLTSALRKKQAAQSMLHSFDATSVVISALHINNAVNTYKNSVTQFAATTFLYDFGGEWLIEGCDNWFTLEDAMNRTVNGFNNLACNPAYSPMSFEQPCLVGALKEFLKGLYIWDGDSNEALPCINVIQDMLAGPGMWNGYLPVIVIFGMVIPTLLSILDLRLDLLQCCLGNFAQLTTAIAPQKLETIKRYAAEYSITVNEDSSLADALLEFQIQLALVKKKLEASRQIGVAVASEKVESSKINSVTETNTSLVECKELSFSANNP